MDIQEKVDKYLDESSNVDDVGDFVKGVKGWLDTFEEMYNYGNFTGAKRLLKDIEKEVKKMLKNV